MNSAAVKLLGLVVALSAVCLSVPVVKKNYGANNDAHAIAVVEFLLQGAEPTPLVSQALENEYSNLERCYNGTFSALKLHDRYRNIDVKQEPLYQYCQENRERMLESVWYKVNTTYGAALLMPVYPIRYLDELVARKHLESESLKDQLDEYRLESFLVERINHLLFCKEMLNLIDVELGQWGLEALEVAKYFEAKTKQPIGRALEVCRIVVDL